MPKNNKWNLAILAINIKHKIVKMSIRKIIETKSVSIILNLPMLMLYLILEYFLKMSA